MLKLLLRLWWLQQRRNFHKRDAIVGAYIILLYVAMGASFFFCFAENGDDLTQEDMPVSLGAVFAVAMLMPDIFLKWVMKRDITAMDDYVKSRPVPEKVWNRFLLASNLVSFWNYVIPVLALPVLFLLLSVPQAVATFFLLLIFSYIDGIFITCYRKATELMLKWPLVLGWIAMLMVMSITLFVCSLMGGVASYVGLLLCAIAVLAGLTVYLYNLKVYNECKRKSSRFRGFRHINLFSLQYIGTMRARRIRNMVLLTTSIFLFDAYLYAFLPNDGHEEFGFGSLVLYTVAAILAPSVCLSQWTFGVEANFFQGLMTKPVRVEQLLQNCFYFYTIVSGMAVLLVVPLLFITDGLTAWVLLGAFCLALFINLFNLPTCLFSSRLEIFSSSKFSMQGANMKINLYAAAFLLPLGGLVAIYYFMGQTAWVLACVALAILSVAVHRKVIARLAAVFYRRRYKRMENFLEV